MFTRITWLTACAAFGALLSFTVASAGGPAPAAPAPLGCGEIEGCAADCAEAGGGVGACEQACLAQASRSAAAAHGLVERCLARHCADGVCAPDTCEAELTACYN
ncbi:MAG: hypothetical protein H6702_14140 [Myxococcales bacterium]|nr:hypothetical protein [Myxococcales bacterium]